MKGLIEYDNQYQRKIDNLLNNNTMLYGFYTFIADKSITTIYNYLLVANNFLKHANKSLEELNVNDFSGFLVKKQKKQEGVKTTSSYKIEVYSALKLFGKYLVAMGILNQNPMSFIERPKAIDSQETIQKREKGYLSKKEVTEYITAAEYGIGSQRSISRQKEWRERDLAIIMTFLNLGIRCSALMKIDVNDIDLNNKTLIVTDKEAKVKICDLSDELVEILNNWIKKREEVLNGEDVDALFISNRKRRMDQSSISRITMKYASNIPDKKITPHKLRATFGTHLYEATKDIYFVQECMEHSNPKTTEGYIRGKKNQSRKSSDIMANLTLR